MISLSLLVLLSFPSVPSAATLEYCQDPVSYQLLRTVDKQGVGPVVLTPWYKAQDSMEQWVIVRDWPRLQALAFFSFVCKRMTLGQRAWELARESFLTSGGISAYAQSPQAFPWWQYWDILFLKGRLNPEQAWRLYRVGSTWTPNIWDRSLRSRILSEWLRKERAYRILQTMKQRENQLAARQKIYRVDPLTWQTRGYLLVHLAPWAVLFYLIWMAMVLTIPCWRRLTPWVCSFGWLIFVGFCYCYPIWLKTAREAWQELHSNLLTAGFITRKVPEPWLALFENRYPIHELPGPLRRTAEKWQKAFVSSLVHYTPPYKNSLSFHVLNWTPLMATHNPRSFPTESELTYRMWTPATIQPASLTPAPWTVLHALYPEARWGHVLRRALSRFVENFRDWKWAWIFVPLGLFFLYRRLAWLTLILPGFSRLKLGHIFHGSLLFFLVMTSLIALVLMHTVRPEELWGSLVDTGWISMIRSIGHRPLIVWGSQYLLVWGTLLFGWTLHFMAYFIDTTHSLPYIKKSETAKHDMQILPHQDA